MSEREEFPQGPHGDPFFERVRLTWPGKREGEEYEVTDEEVEALRRELAESAERKGLRMTYRTDEEIEGDAWPAHGGKGGSLWKETARKQRIKKGDR